MHFLPLERKTEISNVELPKEFDMNTQVQLEIEEYLVTGY